MLSLTEAFRTGYEVDPETGELMELRSYQRLAIRRMVEQPKMGLFADPGLGKTAVALRAFEHLQREGDARRMLVVSPLRAAWATWPEQRDAWCPDLLMHVLHGPGKKPEALTRDVADVYVINPEGVVWLVEQDWSWPDVLVVDESTKFKRAGTKRFRAIRKILGRFDRRYVMTGTPMPNGLLDLFGQVYVLDQGDRLGRYVADYKRTWFVPVPRGNYCDWVPRKNADKGIRAILAPIVLRLDRDDLLELPGRVTTEVRVDLPAAAHREYRRFRQKMVAELDAGTLAASNAGALTVKCRQLANGAVYSDDLVADDPPRPDGVAGGRPYVKFHDGKAEALSDLVDELGGKPVIVCYEFHHDLVAIRRVQGEVPSLTETSGPDAHGLITRWNRGDVPALAISARSDCHGLNLQHGGHVMVWYSLPWDLEVYQQTVERLDRQGQTERVLVYHLIARGTIDERVSAVLRSKDSDQRSLLAALKEDLAA